MDDWRYETATDLDQDLARRLRRLPREPDMLVYGLRSAATILMRTWLRMYHRLHISGVENLPRETSCVLVANHSSHLDALCLQAAIPLMRLHRVFPAAAQDYFFCSLHRTFFAAIFINALPFSRSTHIRQSLALCRNLLVNPGNILILFPEGTRSPDGRMGTFRPGVGAVVAGTDVPVIPCWIAGAYHAWPKARLFPRPHRIRVRIGHPLCYQGTGQDKNDLQRISRELQQAVEALSHEAD
jgi:1-acyl-sn-glycerol-3-phosphate acyltransferase